MPAPVGRSSSPVRPEFRTGSPSSPGAAATSSAGRRRRRPARQAC
jgi:hypothetical protein